MAVKLSGHERRGELWEVVLRGDTVHVSAFRDERDSDKPGRIWLVDTGRPGPGGESTRDWVEIADPDNPVLELLPLLRNAFRVRVANLMRAAADDAVSVEEFGLPNVPPKLLRTPAVPA